MKSVNGTFEPTTEEQNGLPVFKKKGDDGLWVEAVKGASGWRWYLKPVKNKGPESSVCFAYMSIDVKKLGLPQDMEVKWNVSCAEGFVLQDATTVAVGGSSDRLNATVEATRVKLIAAEEEAQKEVGVSCNGNIFCSILFNPVLFFFIL